MVRFIEKVSKIYTSFRFKCFSCATNEKAFDMFKPQKFKKFFEKSLEKIKKDIPAATQSLKNFNTEFSKLSPEKQNTIFRKEGVDDIVAAFPPDIRKVPNVRFFAFLISKFIDSVEAQETVRSEPLEEMETDLKTISKIENGMLGLSEWRLTLIGGHLDEYRLPAPEHVISPWHDVGLTIKNDIESDYFDDREVRLQMFVTTPKEFTIIVK